MNLDPQRLTVKQVRVAIASVCVMALIGAVNIYLTYESVTLNRELNTERDAWKAEKEKLQADVKMTRQMLDSRALIQMSLIKAVSEGRKLTPEERSLIDRNWMLAEYPLEPR